MSRSLSLGVAAMLPSTRKFFDLDADAFEGVVNGQDGVSQNALLVDLTELPERSVCTTQLALRVALHMELTYAAQLRGKLPLPHSIPPNPYYHLARRWCVNSHFEVNTLTVCWEWEGTFGVLLGADLE